MIFLMTFTSNNISKISNSNKTKPDSKLDDCYDIPETLV